MRGLSSGLFQKLGVESVAAFKASRAGYVALVHELLANWPGLTVAMATIGAAGGMEWPSSPTSGARV